MDNGTMTIVLRLIHILAGIFWVGTMFLLAGFLIPTVRETGREGGRFMQHLMQQRRLQVFLGLAMLLTVLTGVIMYARLASATHGAWAGTGPGIAYGVGAIAAIVAAAVGGIVGSSAGRRMLALGQAVRSGGPTPEQQAEIARLQGRMSLAARVGATLLAIAAGAMAIGRYL